MAHKAACHTLSNAFFEIYEHMVQIQLLLKVLFTQDSEVEDLLCGASPGSEPSLFFINNLSSLRFEPVQDNSQHDFTWMTDEANISVILAELKFALFRECNNQRQSSWGWPFFCFTDLVTDLCQNISLGLPSCFILCTSNHTKLLVCSKWVLSRR